MIDEADDLLQLRAAVRGVLGASPSGAGPAPDPTWRQRWSSIAELGATALCVDVAAEGFGFRVDAAAAVAAELGAALHGSPFAGMTAAARALSAADPLDPLVARLVNGESVVAWGRTTMGRASIVDGGADADAIVLHDVGAENS